MCPLITCARIVLPIEDNESNLKIQMQGQTAFAKDLPPCQKSGRSPQFQETPGQSGRDGRYDINQKTGITALINPQSYTDHSTQCKESFCKQKWCTLMGLAPNSETCGMDLWEFCVRTNRTGCKCQENACGMKALMSQAQIILQDWVHGIIMNYMEAAMLCTGHAEHHCWVITAKHHGLQQLQMPFWLQDRLTDGRALATSVHIKYITQRDGGFQVFTYPSIVMVGFVHIEINCYKELRKRQI